MIPTRDHIQIRAWAVRHSAIPAEILGTENGTPALLDFRLRPDVNDDRALRTITWEDFFARFDLFELSMAWDDAGHFALVRLQQNSSRQFNH